MYNSECQKHYHNSEWSHNNLELRLVDIHIILMYTVQRYMCRCAQVHTSAHTHTHTHLATYLPSHQANNKRYMYITVTFYIDYEYTTWKSVVIFGMNIQFNTSMNNMYMTKDYRYNTTWYIHIITEYNYTPHDCTADYNQKYVTPHYGVSDQMRCIHIKYVAVRHC